MSPVVVVVGRHGAECEYENALTGVPGSAPTGISEYHGENEAVIIWFPGVTGFAGFVLLDGMLSCAVKGI